MKTYSLDDWCPKIDPDRMVTHIVSKIRLVKLPEPKKASEIVCPNCGSSSGWWNPTWDAWSCLEDECLDDNKFCEGDVIHKLEKLQLKIQGLPPEYQEANIKLIEQTIQVRERIQRWIAKPSGVAVFAGNPGRGKTYAACACLIDYMANKQHSGRFCNISLLNSTWKSLQRDGMHEIDLVEKLSQIELLVLDDLGKRTPTDAFLDFIYLLLNSRASTGTATIITTNLNSSEMLEKLGDALTSRICSGIVVKFEGPDRRINW